MQRREFLAAAAGTVGLEAAQSPIPIIDTHIHLFDTTRPQGVPWPPKDNKALYMPALPDRYREIAVPLGVVGAIEVEASPWLEDNQWVLDVAAKDKIIVGTIGNLEIGKPEFAKNLERFRKNELFRGIRNGNLWNRDFTAAMANPACISDLRLLQQADLTMDTANPNASLIGDIVKLTDKVPKLRVVIDHLPQMRVPTDATEKRAYEANLKELGKRPQVYVKLSSVFRKNADGTIPMELSHYRDTLDSLCGVFGEGRVIYGSDWPNSDNWKPLPNGMKLVKEYFATKSRTAAEKYFWKNSVAAYKWIHRDVSQPKA